MKTTSTEPVYTVITGASAGLGKELALGFARRGHNLILIALPGRNLLLLCKELEHLFGVQARGYECDLTDEKELNEVVRSILKNYSVDQLVNNAGIGGTIRFAEVDSMHLDRIIHLNIRATTMLIKHFLPKLLNHKKALILNIASMAAFNPIPYKTIYPASKAFIYSFSKSLSRELKGTGVRVVVVNPGQIITNTDVSLCIIKQGFFGRLGLLTCGKITQAILSGIDNNKEVIIPGFINKLNRALIWFIPEQIRISLMEKTIRRELMVRKIFE